MTLQRFLVAVGDSRLAWLGRSGLKPRASERFGPGTWLLQGLAIAVMAIVPGLLGVFLLRLNPGTSGAWWPLAWALCLGAVVGGVGYAMVAVAWNRRAAAMARDGLSEPPVPTPSRWWQRWLVGPFYAVLLFVLTPLLLAVSVDNALGRMAWDREKSMRLARGEKLTLEALQGPAPKEEENFAMSPLIRGMWDFRTVVMNGQSEIVWNDPAAHARVEAVKVPQTFRPGSESKRGVERDGRLKLDWVARSIRIEPFNQPEGISEEMARRYGLATAPKTGGTGKKVKKPSEEEILAMTVADPAQEVLDYLQRFEPELAEIAAASRRPRSRFGLRWDQDTASFLPYLAQLKSFSQTFRIRAVARLAKGDTNGAFEDVRVLFRVSEVLSEDPALISYLVRIAQFAITTSTVWEGLVDHRWTEAQLKELQELFARQDFQRELAKAMRGEGIVSQGMYEQWLGASTGPADGALPIPEDGSAGLRSAGMLPRLPFFAPRGVFRRNQISQARAFDLMLAQIEDPAWPTTVGTLESDEEADNRYLARLGLMPRTPYNILPSMLAPAFRKTQGKTARQSTVARLGEIACGLERYRLRKGSYPENLESLVPEFMAAIPNDPMNGKPPGYRRTDDGWFALWSVGLNGRDDGGVTHPTDNERRGDWVWPTPVPAVGLRLF
jgi:hypothetical protein